MAQSTPNDHSSASLRMSAFGSRTGRSTPAISWAAECQEQKSVLPQEVEHWSLTTLRERLVKIGAKVVRHGRYIAFQLADVAIPRPLFAEILPLVDGLRSAPLPP
jgi:hypothetical protein